MFVEKPLALRLPDCDYSDCVTQVGANLHHHPSAVALKSWLAAGVIGQVQHAELHAGYSLPEVRPDWRESYVVQTGATLDVGWHLVDLALDWLGPATLDASYLRASPWDKSMDGQAALYLRHADEVTSVVTVSLMQPGYRQHAEVRGLIGRAGYDWGRQQACWAPFGEGGGETITWQADANSVAMRAELAAFLECAREGRQTVNPVSLAAETLRILLEARTAWRA
jgi:predicted dehydrogenase